MSPGASRPSSGLFRAVTPIRSQVKRRRQACSRSCITCSPHMHRPSSHTDRSWWIGQPSAGIWASGVGVWRVLCMFCTAELLDLLPVAAGWRELSRFYHILVETGIQNMPGCGAMVSPTGGWSCFTASCCTMALCSWWFDAGVLQNSTSQEGQKASLWS